MSRQAERGIHAEMKSLTEKIAGMKDAEICAALSALFRRIETGAPVRFDPDEIFLDDALNLEIRPGEVENWIWKAPETIRAALFDLELPPNPSQSWFSAGMLAYWMYRRTDYYTQNHIRVLDVALHGFPRPCVVSERDADGIPFAGAVSALTAWEPKNRARGVSEFRAYCAAHGSARTEKAEKADSEYWLYLSKACLTGQRDDCGSEIKILKLDARGAETTLRLKTDYVTPFLVYRTTPGAPPRCLGSFWIPRPAAPGGVYAVSLRYAAAERCLYATVSASGERTQKVRVALGGMP